MSVPANRVSFGAHAFPFSGLQWEGSVVTTLPLLPVRFRLPERQWSSPFDAILDTGSDRTFLPAEMARYLGVAPAGDRDEVRGGGGPFEAARSQGDLAIVDAHYPDVTCWEVHDLAVWVPVEDGAIETPLLGWDVMGLFRISLDSRRKSIELRLQR